MQPHKLSDETIEHLVNSFYNVDGTYVCVSWSCQGGVCIFFCPRLVKSVRCNAQGTVHSAALLHSPGSKRKNIIYGESSSRPHPLHSISPEF